MFVLRSVFYVQLPRLSGPKRAHAQSQYWVVKFDQWHPYYSFGLYARAALAWTEEKRSLRNEKLKSNRASSTEEQRKERMRIRREKETEDHKNQHLAILKRL